MVSFLSTEWLVHQKGGSLATNYLQTYLNSTYFPVRLMKLGSITFAL